MTELEALAMGIILGSLLGEKDLLLVQLTWQGVDPTIYLHFGGRSVRVLVEEMTEEAREMAEEEARG
jgi:hypothetical protein